jgi:hypothetical protein
MYVHAAESQRSKPTHGGTGVHPTDGGNMKKQIDKHLT